MNFDEKSIARHRMLRSFDRGVERANRQGVKRWQKNQEQSLIH